MPRIIQGANSRLSSMLFSQVNADYRDRYPEGLDLKPGSKLHNMIVDEVLHRATESHEVMSTRFSSWNKIDEVLTAYIPTDEDEDEVQNEDERKPVSIVFPYSYAIMETLVTYAMNSLVQDPVFQYIGASDDDTIGAILLQKKIQQDVIKHKVSLSIHTMLRDALAYGVGFTAPGWKERYGTRYQRSGAGFMNRLGRWVGRDMEPIEEDVLLYEGNSLSNIDPYMALPDPHVSVHSIQDGDFFGWIDETSYMSLMNDEANDQSYFNVRYLRALQNATTAISNQSRREVNTTGQGEVSSDIRLPVDVVWMYVTLIPEEWNLGDGKYPTKWIFGVAGDSVVIYAKPARFSHGMYPAAAAAPDFDGYSVAPMGRLEMLYGLQHVVDFMFNSHVANVRKAINDMLVVDPYLLNMNDLKSPKPGKLIRMRRPAWGKGVSDAVEQLVVNDVTRQNVADVSWITSFMNHTSGVDEAMMGSLRQGGPERLTGQEFAGTRASAMSRMERMALVISLQAMQDIGYFFASHTQQFMSQETYVSTSGEWEEQLIQEYGRQGSGRARFSPRDIQIDWDVIVRDGSTVANQDGAAWRALYAEMLKSPETARHFDMVRIFKHIARVMGARNVEDFERKNQQVNMQTMDDEQALREVEKGNLRPVNQAV